MEPVKITLEPHTSGDTWQGIAVIGPVLCGPAGADPMPVPAAYARMWLTKDGAATPSLKLASADSPDFAEADAPITLVSAAGWQFAVPKVQPGVWNPPKGSYSGHFEVVDTAGDVLTIYDITVPVGKNKN